MQGREIQGKIVRKCSREGEGAASTYLPITLHLTLRSHPLALSPHLKIIKNFDIIYIESER